MFRIEAFCDDKKLAKLLWALAELGAYNVSSQPVRDHTGEQAAASNGAHKPRVAAPVDLAQSLAVYANERNLRTINIEGIREFCTAIGYSKKSANHVRKTLAKLRLLGFAPGSPRKGYKVFYRLSDKLKKLATTTTESAS